MKKQYTYLAVVSFCIITSTISAETMDQQVEEHIENVSSAVTTVWDNVGQAWSRMEHRLAEIQDEFENTFDHLSQFFQNNFLPTNKSSLHIAIVETDANNVIISITDIVQSTTTEFSADISYNDNNEPTLLTVTDPEHIITVAYNKNNHISVQAEQKQNIYTKDDNENEVLQSQKKATSSYGKKMKNQIVLDMPEISYDKHTKTMTITFPKKKSTQKKKIVPVTIT